MFDDTPAFDTNAAKGDGARPEFFIEAVKNNFKSDKEGHPVFDDVEFVRILVPGDRKTEWVGQVKEEHKRRWPQQYNAFKAGLELPESGYPITEWAAITKGQAEELRYAHIRTVEELANLPDDALSRCVSMGGTALREKAKRFIEQMQGNSQTEALAAENTRLRETMAAMEQQQKDLLARVAEIEAKSRTETAQ